MTTAADSPSEFTRLTPVDGYLPLEDHALIGNGRTAALVARDGTVPWMCVPRFDSPPLFASLLDARAGGRFVVAPDGLVASRQRYLPDTAVLVTELRTAEGLVRLTDALVLESAVDLTERIPSAGGQLLRSAEVVTGHVPLRVSVEPRGGCVPRPDAGGIRLDVTGTPGTPLFLAANRPLAGLDTTFELEAGDRLDVALTWEREPSAPEPRLIEETAAVWRAWLEAFHYVGPHEGAIRRSAITLKLLDHLPNGAIVAAPTSSLPAQIGGERNWDYRYTWVRDAAFSVYALRRIGLEAEAGEFLVWVLETVGGAEEPRVLYDIDGGVPTPERLDEHLEGYRRSAPVRWGNRAAEQTQHDVYGEVLDCAFQWAARGGEITEELWTGLRPFIERAATRWDERDHGIWEVRTAGRPFTYSAAMCQVALDRGARLAERLGLPGDPDGWRRTSEGISARILDEAWDEERRALGGRLGEGALDASVLALPLRRVVPATHPKMVATTEAISRGLSAGDGLLYRYLVDEAPDGLSGQDGAFLLCSFWLVDNYIHQGRLDEASELLDTLCGKAGPLGLFPEQIDPSTGAFLGNYPQALSHVGLISTAVTLTRALAHRQRADEDPQIPLDQAFKTAAMGVPPPDPDDESGSATR